MDKTKDIQEGKHLRKYHVRYTVEWYMTMRAVSCTELEHWSTERTHHHLTLREGGLDAHCCPEVGCPIYIKHDLNYHTKCKRHNSCTVILQADTVKMVFMFIKFILGQIPARYTLYTGTLWNLPEPASGTYTNTRRNSPEPSGTFLQSAPAHTGAYLGCWLQFLI